MAVTLLTGIVAALTTVGASAVLSELARPISLILAGVVTFSIFQLWDNFLNLPFSQDFNQVLKFTVTVVLGWLTNRFILTQLQSLGFFGTPIAVILLVFLLYIGFQNRDQVFGFIQDL